MGTHLSRISSEHIFQRIVRASCHRAHFPPKNPYIPGFCVIAHGVAIFSRFLHLYFSRHLLLWASVPRPPPPILGGGKIFGGGGEKGGNPMSLLAAACLPDGGQTKYVCLGEGNGWEGLGHWGLCPILWLAVKLSYCGVGALKKDGNRRQGKGRRAGFGGKICPIPCHDNCFV